MNEPEVLRLTKELFEDDAEEQRKLVSKLEKKGNERPPAHETFRLVDRKDRWESKSWHSQMQELAFVGSARYDVRRRKLRSKDLRR